MKRNDKPDIIVCAVDNDMTRVCIAEYGIKNHIPVIFTAVSSDGNHGYVFIQEPGKACLACLFPEAVGNEKTPCPGTPAIKDILKAIAGIDLYAIDATIMNRKRNWNYRMIYLAGYVPDHSSYIEQNPQCRLNCSHSGHHNAQK